MIDFAVFDSILDSVFVVDRDGTVVYCNDAAATFSETSAKRTIGRRTLNELFSLSEPGILPLTESSPGWITPSAFIETDFQVCKSARSGKGQVSVRPISENHWLIYLRDVSLEEALHKKYRSELSQKEQYVRNLEQLVQLRTAQIQSINVTLDAILNSLGQGFFTFGPKGECGPTYSRACVDLLLTPPAGKKVWDVLRIPEAERETFQKWVGIVFDELLDFEDSKELAPASFPHSDSRTVNLEYQLIRDEEGKVSEVVVIATDKTVETRTQAALEAEKNFAAMIVCLVRNRDQFVRFLVSAQETVAGLVGRAKNGLNADHIAEEFRILHTLEGEAGTFSIPVLVKAARTAQVLLEPFLGGHETPIELQAGYFESVLKMRSDFDVFMHEHSGIFGMSGGQVARTVFVPLDQAMGLLAKVKAAKVPVELSEAFEDVFFKVPVVSRFGYFNDLLQTMSLSLEKKIKPLVIEGGDLLIYPKPYERFFSTLVHVFRNAMDHGLELPGQRVALGKAPEGEIRVKVQRRDGQIMIKVTDDGQGIDPKAIRLKLLEKFPDRDFSHQTDEEVIGNVFLPGFSSREEVGEFSGRGVGLDALREEIIQLGGSLSLTSELGRGTVIDMHLPDLDNQVKWPRSA